MNHEPSIPFRDPDLPLEVRTRDLLERLTLEEKVAQMLNHAPGIERLGIPAYDWWSEGLHGVARSGLATVFPQAIGMAATFDPGLVRRVAAAIADEARAKHHAAASEGRRGRYRGLTLWAPNINIFRDPRWGRGQETYGEDPVLAGALGTAFVEGLQGDDPKHLKVAACAKHFAVHSGPEADRHTFDAKVGEQDLWETYLPAFRTLVTQSGVEAVMGAYNRVNGDPCCAHPRLIGEILRGQWNFAGHFVSDCWAIVDFYKNHKIVSGPAEAAAMAVKQGCDLCCGCAYEHLVDAVRAKLVTEAEIDLCVARLIRTKLRLGLFDPPERVPYARIPVDVVRSPEHLALAREAAARSVVLLKNNGILPLPRDIGSLYVTGPNAADTEPLMGNYYGCSPQLSTILEGVMGMVTPTASVEYRRGVELAHAAANPIDWVTYEASLCDACVAVMGLSQLLEGEEGDAIASPHRGDRESIELPGHQVEFLRKLKDRGTRLVVVLCTGSPLAIPEIHDFADAIVCCWYPGEEGGRAVADVLFGGRSPSGRLPVTWPRATGDLPDYRDYAMERRTYRFSEVEPLYPFGFGLSFTRFRYAAITTDTQELRPGAGVSVEVEVSNEGNVASDEVVQLYICPPDPGFRVPRQSLRRFQRIHLDPGEKRVVSFSLNETDFAVVHPDGREDLAEGTYRIAVGGAAPTARSAELGAPDPQWCEIAVRAHACRRKHELE